MLKYTYIQSETSKIRPYALKKYRVTKSVLNVWVLIHMVMILLKKQYDKGEFLMKKKLTALLLILVLALTGCSFSNMNLKDEPSKHIMYSFLNTAKTNDSNTSVNLQFDVDTQAALDSMYYLEEDQLEQQKKSIEFASAVLKEFSLDATINNSFADKSSILNFDTDMKISYKEKPLLKADVSLIDSLLTIEAPQIHELPFYQFVEDFAELNRQLQNMDLIRYKDLLFKEDGYTNLFEKNAHFYENEVESFLASRIKDSYEESITTNLYGDIYDVDVTSYDIELTQEDFLKFNIKLIEEAKNDMDLRNLVLARMDDVKQIMLESKDYELFGLTEEMFIAEFEDSKIELYNNWTTIFENWTEELEYKLGDIYYYGGAMDIKLTLSIDDDNLIRKIYYEFTQASTTVKETIIYNGFDEDVKPNVAKDLENGIDLTNLGSYTEDSEVIQKQIGQNIIDKVIMAPNFLEMLDDIKEKAEKMLPEEEKANVIQSLDPELMSLPFKDL